jgi:hypothetical protein
MRGAALDARTTTRTTMRCAATARRAARGARGVATTRAKSAESQSATNANERERDEEGAQKDVERRRAQTRMMARSPLSSMMAFPSLASAATPFGLTRSAQRELANVMNMMDDVMTGGALAPFETLDPFKITMHADHTQGVPQQILNFPMGTTSNARRRGTKPDEGW